MCIAEDYSKQLLSIYHNINEEFESLRNKQSQIDLYIQDVLHMIEAKNFNASEGYKFAKMIHDARIKRRDIKNEIEPLMKLKHEFIDRNINSLTKTHQAVVRKDSILTNLTDNKVYVPRVIGKQQSRMPQQKPFTPIPIPSTTVVQNEQMYIIGNAIHKKTNEKLKVISKLDDTHYFIMKKDGHKEIINSKNMINFECLQSAK